MNFRAVTLRLVTMGCFAATAAGAGLFSGCSGEKTTTGFTGGNDAGGGSSGSSGDNGGGNLLGDRPDSGGTTCAATSTKAEKASVDVVFVIDDSGSMTEEMTQIKTNVNTFATKIGQTGLDYRVIFIVRKGSSGNTICVPAPLAAAGCANNPPRFYHVDQDVQSDDALELILATYDSSSPTLAWNKYLRLEAFKIFILVSDDDAGNYGSPVRAAQFDPQLLAKAPAGMFGTAQKRKYIFDSIVGWDQGTPQLSGTSCSSAVNNGAEYQKLSQLTGGLIDSVCKTDYSGVLDNLAKGIATRLACEFALPKPDAGTLDPSTVVIQFTPSNSPQMALTQVTDASKCGQVPNAWFYDDNTNPTKIVLCQTTCTTVSGDEAGKIDMLLGCKAPPAK